MIQPEKTARRVVRYALQGRMDRAKKAKGILACRLYERATVRQQ